MTYQEYLDIGKIANARGERRFEECPECGDTGWHFYYNERREKGNCKKCDYSPDRRTLVRDLRLHDYERKEYLESITEALDALDAQGVAASDVLDMEEDEEEYSPLIPLPREAQPVYHYTKPLSYLLQRDLMTKEIFDSEFMYCTKGRFRGRIIIPIRNYQGEVVGFTARGVYRWSSTPKYDTPSAFRISKYLLGEDQITPGGNVILVEGPFDKFRVGPEAVATFGKKLSHSQMHKLMQLDPSEVTVMFDSDAHGASMKLAALLSHYWPTRVILLEEGDPGDTPRRKLWSMIAETPLFQSIEWGLREVG